MSQKEKKWIGEKLIKMIISEEELKQIVSESVKLVINEMDEGLFSFGRRYERKDFRNSPLWEKIIEIAIAQAEGELTGPQAYKMMVPLKSAFMKKYGAMALGELDDEELRIKNSYKQ